MEEGDTPPREGSVAGTVEFIPVSEENAEEGRVLEVHQVPVRTLAALTLLGRR